MLGPFPYPSSQTLPSLMVTSHIPFALWSPVCQSRSPWEICRGGVRDSGADSGRRFVCRTGNTVSCVLQAPFLRMNLVHGRGQKSEWDVGLRVSFWSCFATCSFSSIHQSSLEIVSWRNSLIEYISFKLSIALIFPQVACILELLTFRLRQLIKMFLCHY